MGKRSVGYVRWFYVAKHCDTGNRWCYPPLCPFAQYEDKEGLRHSYAIPERLKTFVSTINNYLNLETKPNKDKKVAIYYYKGPGQNALTAAGMEVVPSLYNLLLRMKQEGYNVSGLPANAQELAKMIQAQGAVFNSYAEGAFDEFMKTEIRN